MVLPSFHHFPVPPVSAPSSSPLCGRPKPTPLPHPWPSLRSVSDLLAWHLREAFKIQFSAGRRKGLGRPVGERGDLVALCIMVYVSYFLRVARLTRDDSGCIFDTRLDAGSSLAWWIHYPFKHWLGIMRRSDMVSHKRAKFVAHGDPEAGKATVLACVS